MKFHELTFRLVNVFIIENQLYWCDTELQTIERKELPDSPGLREVVIDQNSQDGRYAPFDLVFYNDNLYWSDSGVNGLFRAYKNGEREMSYGSPSTIFKKVRGIHLFEGGYGTDSFLIFKTKSNILFNNKRLDGEGCTFGCQPINCHLGSR